MRAQEGEQFGELALPLARVADHDRGAQRDFGDALAQRREELLQVGAGVAAVHAREHPAARVLDRDVEIGAELRRLGKEPDDLLVDPLGVQVEQADAEVPGERRDGAHERGEPAAAPAFAEARDVLPDEVELAHAGVDQRARLVEHRGARTAGVRPADRRDQAVVAAVAAAVGDLQVRPGAGGQRAIERAAREKGPARAPQPARPRRPERQPLAEARDLLGREQQVHRGVARRQLVGEAVDHAAGDDDEPPGALRLPGNGGGDRLVRLLDRRADEGAGVDQQQVRVLALGHQPPAAGAEPADQVLGVHQVLRAAEAHDAREGHPLRPCHGRKYSRPPKKASCT